MDSELKKQLEEIHALARDNNRMLRAIRRDAWYSLAGKIIFWAIFLLGPVYLYYAYVAPVIERVAPTTTSIGSATATSTNFFENLTIGEIQKIIEQYRPK